jgi:hypothetical protein
LITISWPLLVEAELNANWLLWILVLLNVIRGLIGFRAFDNTRKHIKLIMESFKDVSYFLTIFSYTTLRFGLLKVAGEHGGGISAKTSG